MKVYYHKDFPEMEAQISYEWHKDYRDDNYTLINTRLGGRRVICRIKDSEIENNPFWILKYEHHLDYEKKG
jgi:hypothetical protein